MKLSKEEIQCLGVLDRLGINAKFCRIDKNFITFFVPNKYYRNALKKLKSSKLRKKFSRKIEIFPYVKDAKKCTLFGLKTFNVNPLNIELKKSTIYIKLDAEDKSKIFRKISKFKRFKELLKNTFEIQNIKV